MRSSEGQNLEERARCWRRRKNEREEVEERLVKEGALLHMKGASLIRPKLHCGKTRSTCIARVSIRTVPLPRSRFENHFPESLFVKIVSQKGQNENFTLATLSSNGKKWQLF
jgi:hypothetical protein